MTKRFHLVVGWVPLSRGLPDDDVLGHMGYVPGCMALGSYMLTHGSGRM